MAQPQALPRASAAANIRRDGVVDKATQTTSPSTVAAAEAARTVPAISAHTQPSNQCMILLLIAAAAVTVAVAAAVASGMQDVLVEVLRLFILRQL